MGLMSLHKNETRLTTVDETIEAVLANLSSKRDYWYKGIRLYRLMDRHNQVTNQYGTQQVKFTASKRNTGFEISCVVLNLSKKLLECNEDCAIMYASGNEEIKIDYSTLDEIDFFQYECIGIQTLGVSHDKLKKLIHTLKGIIEHASNSASKA